MARIVGEEIFSRATGGTYPYDEWGDGKARLLTAGEDFPGDMHPRSVGQTLRAGYATRGLRLKTEVKNDRQIAIQVTGRL
jgi:hypothetical protein